MDPSCVELIAFQPPRDEGRSLYVSCLPANMDSGEMWVSEIISLTIICSNLLHIWLQLCWSPPPAGADELALLSVWASP